MTFWRSQWLSGSMAKEYPKGLTWGIGTVLYPDCGGVYMTLNDIKLHRTIY